MLSCEVFLRPMWAKRLEREMAELERLRELVRRQAETIAALRTQPIGLRAVPGRRCPLCGQEVQMPEG